jgi:hypothetical protein
MRILWSPQSLRDLDAIHGYIAKDSEHYADLTICCEKSITIPGESRGHYHASVSNHNYGYRCDVPGVRNSC